MGAPVVGSELRAFITTGGGIRFKNMSFKRRSKRVQMIFPLKGSDRRGLVSLEAKKRKVGVEGGVDNENSRYKQTRPCSIQAIHTHTHTHTLCTSCTQTILPTCSPPLPLAPPPTHKHTHQTVLYRRASMSLRCWQWMCPLLQVGSSGCF